MALHAFTSFPTTMVGIYLHAYPTTVRTSVHPSTLCPSCVHGRAGGYYFGAGIQAIQLGPDEGSRHADPEADRYGHVDSFRRLLF